MIKVNYFSHFSKRWTTKEMDKTELIPFYNEVHKAYVKDIGPRVKTGIKYVISEKWFTIFANVGYGRR